MAGIVVAVMIAGVLLLAALAAVVLVAAAGYLLFAVVAGGVTGLAAPKGTRVRRRVAVGAAVGGGLVLIPLALVLAAVLLLRH